MLETMWHELLYQPVYNFLILMYWVAPYMDMGIAMIFLTLYIRLALLPLSVRSAQSEQRLARLKPVLEEVKKRYQYDIEKQRRAIRRLLIENNISVFTNFISILFQALFFIVLYRIFSSGLQPDGEWNQLYSFIPHPGVVNTYFLDRFNLVVPDMTASLFATAVVFLQQASRRVPRMSAATTIDKITLFALPAVTYIGTSVLPSSKAIFIATTVLFSMWIQAVKWITVQLVVKDEELKANLDNLWTNS